MKKLIFILAMSFAFSNFSNASEKVINTNSLDEITVSHEMNSELSSLIEDGTIISLIVTDNSDTLSAEGCTLSAEVSYNGLSVTLSITADDCYKAGAGIAQAIKGFYAEMTE
jgi:hypothetical protein